MKTKKQLARNRLGFITMREPCESENTYLADEDYRNHLQLMMMTLFIFISSVILSISNLIQHQTILSIVTFIVLGLSFVYEIILLRTEALDVFFPWILILTVYSVVIPYYILSSHDWINTFWICIIPILFITTLGMKKGQIGAIGIILISVIFLCTPLNDMLPGAKQDDKEWIHIMVFLSTEILSDFLGSGVAFLNTIIIRRLTVLEAKFRDQANHDNLTGLSNQKAFTDFGNNIHSHFTNGDDILMMFIDIDNFKHINDTYGHIVGNQFLCSIAEVMKKDPHLLAARWGGDEFVIMEKNMPREVFIAEAKNLKNDVLSIRNEQNPEARISISIGLAIMKYDESFDFDKLIQKADVQAHAAKDSGKNCVRIESNQV